MIDGIDPGAYTVTVSADWFVIEERTIGPEPGADGVEDVALESVEPTVATYTDDVVRTGGLRDAIDDWRDGDIDTDRLHDVTDYWRSGESVT